MSSSDIYSAKKALESGNTIEAIEHFERAIKRYPENMDALRGLAAAQEQMGAYNKAKQSWQKIVELSPATLEAYNHMGEIAIKQQDFALAVEYFQSTLKLAKPDSSEHLKAQDGLSTIALKSPYYKEKMLKAQTDRLNDELKFRKIEERIAKEKTGKIILDQAKALFAQGRYPESIQSFDTALIYFPGDPDVLKLRQAAVLARRKATDNALTDIAIKKLIEP